MTRDDRDFWAVYNALVDIAPCRVRLTAPNGYRQSGDLTAHPIRGCDDVDLRLDGRGGVFHSIATVEVKRGARYEPLHIDRP